MRFCCGNAFLAGLRDAILGLLIPGLWPLNGRNPGLLPVAPAGAIDRESNLECILRYLSPGSAVAPAGAIDRESNLECILRYLSPAGEKANSPGLRPFSGHNPGIMKQKWRLVEAVKKLEFW